MKSDEFLVSFAVFFVVFKPSASISSNPLLLLVSFDGFRWDFLNSSLTPNLWKLSSDGVRFEKGVRSQMVTVTAPNHYSIVTGLFEESHGIVGNEFFDPVIGDFYDLFNFSKNFTRSERSKNLGLWYHGEPIWLTNQRAGNGKLSGSMLWPAGDANISGEYPKNYKSWTDFYNLTIWKQQFNTLLEWFLRPTDPINLGLFYVAQPDHFEHQSGVGSSNTTKVIKDLDSLVGYMQQKLAKSQISDRINLIITTDHGHANYAYPRHVIPMRDYLEEFPEYREGKLVRTGSDFSLAKSDKSLDMDRIFQDLKVDIEKNYTNGEIRIKRKADFPNYQYHWTNTVRIGDILILPKIGWALDYNSTGAELKLKANSTRSTHGYFPDYNEMRGVLVLWGPAFKEKFMVPSNHTVENIDLYELMCRVLKIEAAPNNGSLDRIKMVLKNFQGAESEFFLLEELLRTFFSDKKVMLVVVFAVIIPSVIFLCYILSCAMTRQTSCLGGKNIGKNRRSRGYERLKCRSNPSVNAASNGPAIQGSGGVGQMANGRERPLLYLDQNVDSMSEDEI